MRILLADMAQPLDLNHPKGHNGGPILKIGEDKQPMEGHTGFSIIQGLLDIDLLTGEFY